MKWIVALGLAVMVATILYAWYRGGDDAGAAALVLAACA